MWVFDPTGAQRPGGRRGAALVAGPARESWDGALLIARAMTANIGAGTTDRSHWANRAQALLAPMLHAAAVHGRDMETVVDWVMRHDLDEPAGILLEDERCSRAGVREPARAAAHRGPGALLDLLRRRRRAAGLHQREPRWRPPGTRTSTPPSSSRSADTIYIHAPPKQQAAAAPIVCGLLAEIRRETYRAHANGQLAGGRMLFALDEVANIAPLESCRRSPQKAAAKASSCSPPCRTSPKPANAGAAQADGFLTLFGTKLILPGSPTAARWRASRRCSANTTARSSPTPAPARACSAPWPVATARAAARDHVSTQRTRVLSPGEIANIPAGRALHLDGVRWELAHAHPRPPDRTVAHAHHRPAAR